MNKNDILNSKDPENDLNLDEFIWLLSHYRSVNKYLLESRGFDYGFTYEQIYKIVYKRLDKLRMHVIERIFLDRVKEEALEEKTVLLSTDHPKSSEYEQCLIKTIVEKVIGSLTQEQLEDLLQAKFGKKR